MLDHNFHHSMCFVIKLHNLHYYIRPILKPPIHATVFAMLYIYVFAIYIYIHMLWWTAQTSAKISVNNFAKP